MKKRGVSIKRATIKDLPAVLHLHVKQSEETKKFLQGLGKKGKLSFYSPTEIKKLISSPSGYIALATINGVPIGCGSASIENAPSWYRYSKRGYLGMLYVDKPYRRAGVARALETVRMQWLKSKGVKVCICAILAPNHAALALKEKSGFNPSMVYMFKRL